ncbi:MAG TPA: hypothetical protein VKX49_12605 [Bryobacteraceae bacterium]|nr:hypothetical protein [Bryobacteraceae bacterium]
MASSGFPRLDQPSVQTPLAAARIDQGITTQGQLMSYATPFWQRWLNDAFLAIRYLLNRNVYAEIPQGMLDGTNAAFTLLNPPNPATSLQLFVNGSLQKQGSDYTLTSAQITFANAPAMKAVLQAFYTK